jgi:hypothetical protein
MSVPLVLLLVAWFLPPLAGFFARIIKLEPMRMPYTATLFGLLALFSVCLRADWVVDTKASLLMLVGAVAGIVSSMVAISVANLFLPRGLERTLSTFRMGGIGILVIDLAVSMLLGSWALGALYLWGYRLMLSSRVVAAR